MPAIPKATTTVSATAGTPASGLGLVCVFAPVATNPDITPRIFGNSDAIHDQHGYSEGLEYAALHFQRTRKSVLFIGLPINTPGVIGRENTSGNSGSSVSSLAAGSAGVLSEHDGVIKVIRGGTIGTDQILLEISLDDNTVTKRVRLGTASSYVIPYVNVTVSFAAGDLVAGDTIHTWHGTAPLSDSADWATARTALAAQTKAFRSVVLVGDLQTDTEADTFLAQMNNYETVNDRFVYGRAAVYDRAPLATMSKVAVNMTGSPTLTFAEVGGTGDTITRSAGSWISDGFQVGDTFTVAGSASNNVTGPIETLSALVITLDTLDLADEGPVSNCTVVGAPTLDFLEVGGTGDTITRSRGSFLDDGFRAGDLVNVTGTASNNITGAAGVDTVTALVITLDTDDLVTEEISVTGVTIIAGQTKAVWMGVVDAAFASVDDDFRIDLAAGRGRELSPFTGWRFRRSAMWAASVREYGHDVHVATWRKDLGPVGFDLDDADENLVEWDDRVDGGAGSAARFTTLRTWPNGPSGTFITQSLTRALEGSILQPTHNAAVVNLAQGVCQAATEATIGRSLVLNDDGTATTDALKSITTEVNGALELALLKNTTGEGQRASKAVWTPADDDVLNVAEATLTGVLELGLNGTIHKVDTKIRVLSGGQ